MSQSFEAYLTQEDSGRAQGTFQQSEAGSSYFQRWSALSSKGVSFSRNSKAQLTSSVKSYKEPKRAIWPLGFPPHHSLPCRSPGTPSGTKACKSTCPPTGFQGLDGEKGGASPHVAVLAPITRQPCLLSSLEASCLQTGCVQVTRTDAQVHSHFPSPRHKNTLLRSQMPSSALASPGRKRGPMYSHAPSISFLLLTLSP